MIADTAAARSFPAGTEGFAAGTGRLAFESLMEEVSVTPKPGLVDAAGSGAHTDMDFSTFQVSARALEPYFAEFVLLGAHHGALEPVEIFARGRAAGLQAERAMFHATGGVNTHKGLVFSLGLLCAAAGALRERGAEPTAENLCAFAARMCSGLVRNELAEPPGYRPGRPKTNGERLFADSGVMGIRGEAESGFATVRNVSLPRLRGLSLLHPGRRNDVLLMVLLALMSSLEDTNVLARGGFAALAYVRASAARAERAGGPFSVEGMKHIENLDAAFTAGNISPGGSADLLAVTIFLDRLERENGRKKR